jgi:hypothetical protein
MAIIYNNICIKCVCGNIIIYNGNSSHLTQLKYCSEENWITHWSGKYEKWTNLTSHAQEAWKKNKINLKVQKKKIRIKTETMILKRGKDNIINSRDPIK